MRSRAPLGAAALDGVVRVSASPVFASHFLAPRLARAQRAWPALRIDLLGEMHAANLYAREADLAVRLSRPTEPGPPRAGSARCASRCARRRNGRTRRPTPGRSSATTTRSRKRRSTSGSPASLPGAVSRSSPTAAAQHRACAAGAGVALLPRFLVDEPAAHAGAPLVELTAAPRCDIEREIWLVVHPDVRRSPRVQRVADAIAEAVHAADGRL